MLSAAERAALDRLRARYPDPRAASVTVLKWLQQRRGYLSDATLEDAAGYLGLPVAELEGLATFYNLLFRRPVGRHVILLCDSVPCWIRGCQEVEAAIGRELGIGPGETSPDGLFTLLPSVCLGACDRAPAMLVGRRLHGPVEPGRLAEVLDRYRRGTDGG